MSNFHYSGIYKEPKTQAACHMPNILVFYQGAVDPLATPTLPSSPQLYFQ